MCKGMWLLALVACGMVLPLRTDALDNGLGLTPQMGFSSWNAIGSQVNAAYMKKVAQYFIDNGLQEKGWKYMNVDEGWMLGRDPTTLEPVADPTAFPGGMKALGDNIHSLGFLYGLYTSRGVTQCARPEYASRCMHNPPNPAKGCEGTNGYEHTDGTWMVAQGADYLKEDSCGGSQDHATAFSDYAKMRDTLNATGRKVYFSLCGWNEWYAPPDPSVGYKGGYSLGNSWRIYGDGKNWGALSGAVNTMARITNYTGPGGWNDPDLLIGPECHIEGVPCGNTDLQARTQFSLWCLFPAPLLISQNVLNWSSYALETYSNTAAIAINQDSLGRAAIRIAGNDLAFPCSGADCTNVWGRELSGGRLAVVYINNADSSRNVTCGPVCFASLRMPARGYRIQDVWDNSTKSGGANTELLTPLTIANGATVSSDDVDFGPRDHNSVTTFSHTEEVPGGGGSRMFVLIPMP